MKKEITAKTNKPKAKRSVSSVVWFVVTLLLFLVAACVLFTTINAKKQGKVPTFFGYSFSIVVTGSMEPDIHVGELLVVKETPMEEIKVGDDILFTALSGQIAGQQVVHRVTDIGSDDAGLYLRTAGINNPIGDSDPVRAGNYLGRAAAHSAFWGKAFSFLSNVETLMMLVVLVLVIPFAVKQIVKIVKAAKEKDPEAADEKTENQDPDKKA